MTCTHVLGLIDAGPFAEYPRAHLDAAWQHARQCATCGPALEAARALTADLGALSHPAPPRDLTATVLARIAQRNARPAPAAAPTSERQAPSGVRDPSAWTTAFGTLAAALVVVVTVASGELVPMDIASYRAGGITAGLVAMPATPAGVLALGAGLVLYVTGLFATLGGGARRRR